MLLERAVILSAVYIPWILKTDYGRLNKRDQYFRKTRDSIHYVYMVLFLSEFVISWFVFLNMAIVLDKTINFIEKHVRKIDEKTYKILFKRYEPKEEKNER